MLQLNYYNSSQITGKNELNLLQNLPEKILQFGTGVLLRGLCNEHIDKANKMGVFNGKIVVVKSTDKGDTLAFDLQDSLYTVCVKGIKDDAIINYDNINASISRVINANTHWNSILELASSESLEIIISNTTEVGIQLVNESITASVPKSFPAKVLGFLYERFRKAPHLKTIIIPTELVVDNGLKLKEICIELSNINTLGSEFMEWFEQNVTFCNSLVDRIVPGKPEKSTLHYQDDLICMAEAYNLWAIEGNEYIKNKLSFETVNEDVVVEPNIEKFRELKLRLLNGTHTLSCGLGFLNGKNLVRENMEDPTASHFVETLMLEELALALPLSIDKKTYTDFGSEVLSRFKNPFINHKLIDITVQYSAKMKMRNIPLLLEYSNRYQSIPNLFCKGFAGYLLFMKAIKTENGKYFGTRNNEYYPIQCDKAGVLAEAWEKSNSTKELVNVVLKNTELWGEDLSKLLDFEAKVLGELNLIIPSI